MTIRCQCGASYNYDEKKFEGVAVKKVKCSKCKKIMEVKNPQFAASPGGVAEHSNPWSTSSAGSNLHSSRTDGSDTVTLGEAEPGEGTLMSGQSVVASLTKPLQTPKYSLSVIVAGEHLGKVVPIVKSKVVIGRVGSDIEIDDPESSRRHAEIEIRDQEVILRDTGSTNGTYFKGQRITEVKLEHESEFRIGNTIFVLYVSYFD